ncbi:hypothetical protein FIBSPDRAFT_872954 [Athelia psychrophila]|uniref:Pyridoxamine 5'-phosphate oxidase Alr4036 family FMN-binding domain-containing protein n=1 Tax=Athelia psychrophila TaxID=1759441 RepID=A0A165Z078_9AGAM|nr:hypothetical protein FIBSPDRAFT_872954 [Fibularhizoctonia sp. CBS 109695]
MHIPASPRWKTALVKAIDGTASPFQLASLDANSIPHVRTHLHRGFFEAKAAPHLPLIFTTTDIRTPKVTQLLAQPTVEAVYWIEGSGEQYRVVGRTSIIPAPAHPLYARFDPTHGPALTALKNEGVDWEKERTKSFDSMSAHMKATWCRPVPGTKLEGGYEEAKKWPVKLPKLGEGTDQEKHYLEIALANFALVVIDPLEVDYVEFSMYPNQRTKFKKEGESWVEEIVVP